MRIKTLWFLPILILALALVMGGCTKEGDPVKGNVAPDTRVLSYVVSSKAELDTLGAPTTNYMVTVYWAGSDIDGTIKSFLFDDGVNKGESLRSQENFVYNFANASASYTLSVQAKDNLETVDPTPAEVIIVRNSGGVETMILDGPPHGAEVSPGISYKVGATSLTGHVKSIAYRINDGGWVIVNADANGEAIIEFVGLDAGATVLSFRGIRDDDVVDESPASISLLVRIGKFMPVLENMSPVVDGGGWFEGVNLTFNWTQTTSHYYGALPAEAYCATAGSDLAPPAEYNLNPDEAFGDGWMAASTFEYGPTAGNHVFYLKVRDTGGGVDTMRIRFSAAAFQPDKGILVVNGVDEGAYGSEITDHVNAGTFWTGYNVDFWDLFGTMSNPKGTIDLSASNATYVGGGSQLTPDLMAQYRTILWLGNGYNGDFELYALTPVYPYLQAGGNLVLATRYAADFMDLNLTNYCQISWREGAAPGSSAGVTLAESKAIFPGLVDLSPFSGGSSFTDVWVTVGFNGASAVTDDQITNYNGSGCYSTANGTSTLIYAHRSNTYNAGYPFSFVRGTGVWAHPNLPFSDPNVEEYPVNGEASGAGNLVLISGRNYRHNFANVSLVFPTILEKMCAEPK